MSMRRSTVLLSIVVPCLLLASPLRAGELEVKTFERAWSLIDRYFYDSDHKGIDWKGVHDKYRPLVDHCDSPAAVRPVIQKMLSELKASHCSVLDGFVYDGMMAELGNKRESTFGLVIEESTKGHFFTRAMFEGGPAEESGLKVGDRILKVEGKPIAKSEHLVDAGYDPGLDGPKLFFLRAGKDVTLELTIESEEGGATSLVTLAAQDMNAVDAMGNSARIMERDGKRIGVIHMWYCSRGVSSTLRKALLGKLKDCDALVLDVRGRGGYADVVTEVLDCFRESTPGFLDRIGGKGGSTRPPVWRKPVVFLIDGRSRSAKEILAYRVRSGHFGLLVGEKTEGAVLGATFHPLPDGSYLELPGMSVPVDGVDLEGVGVAPDVEVDFPLPYAQGFDPILEGGLAVAAAQAKRFRRGPY